MICVKERKGADFLVLFINIEELRFVSFPRSIFFEILFFEVKKKINKENFL